MKKLYITIVSILICLSLCGCKFSGSNMDSILKTPMPTGDLYEIQQALEKSTGKKVDLRYPKSGSYRSAFVANDITSDGVDEFFVFYNTQTDDAVNIMHINLIRLVEGEWVSTSDMQVEAGGIETISFTDLDGDGAKEIITGWNTYSNNEYQMTVYSMFAGKLVQRMQEKYTVYATCDFNEDMSDELVLVSLNTIEKVSTARLFKLTNKGFSEEQSCSLDGNVTSYTEPVVSRFENGQKAIFIDGVKEKKGMITETLCYNQSGVLTAPFYDKAAKENYITQRPSQIATTDLNGDGFLDIPHMIALFSGEQYSDGEKTYMTNWQSFDGTAFNIKASTIMNYIDGWYLELPESWSKTMSIVRKPESKLRIFYRWDWENTVVAEEVLRIQVFTISEWETRNPDLLNMFEIARDKEQIYAAQIGCSQSMQITEQQLLDSFHLLQNTVKGLSVR